MNIAKTLFGVKELKPHKYEIIKLFFGGTFAPIGIDCTDKNLMKILGEYVDPQDAKLATIDTSGCFIDITEDGILLGLDDKFDGMTIDVDIFGNMEGININ